MMVDATAIAAATATLRRLLLDGLPKQDALLAQVDVTSLPPDKVNANVDRATLNVFLYRVAPSAALRNVPPSHEVVGDAVDTGSSLTLQYLLTAYGRVDQQAGDLSHRVLGAAMSVLHSSPIVNAVDLDVMVPLHTGLAASRALRITPLYSSLEEMARIWAMFQTNYRLSAAYEVALLPVHQPRSAPPAAEATEPRTREKFAAAVQALGLEPESSDALLQIKTVLDTAAPSGGFGALFAGGSAQSMLRAAESLANETGRALHRVDLSSIADKYVGETEKNLDRLFSEAERAGAILLFDEADALFGKRGDVRDSHDRYANLEVSHLLQRLDSYAGLVIATSASKASIDAAFLRRLRFVVEFPAPVAE